MRITVQPGLEVNCEVTDYLWPWIDTTPVLMQHGFSRNAGFWRRWIPLLGETRRVYRPDVRGCGQSDSPAPGDSFDAETLLRDLDRVFEATRLERVHWVGESSGGVLGVLYAARHPERIASVTLINTPVRVLANAQAHSLSVTEATTSEAIMKYGVGGWCEQTLAQRLDKDIASPELQNFYITEMGKVKNYVGAAIHDAIEPLDTFPLLKTFKMPFLLLCGDKKKSTVEAQRIMEAEIPRVELKIFEGYGNALGTIAPERSAREALDFWKRVETAPDSIGAKSPAR